ncbi:hypothetical protein MCAP1_003393 [Malassezia caprae]|uniref:Uncharacterized protein n=1 Tax=Malassezia caprae TaxID=1381934 RepID=A0AAF0EEC6_9BASI|nr:hypothetical protein MCAP1_003393 [Malassezia caprae]
MAAPVVADVAKTDPESIYECQVIESSAQPAEEKGILASLTRLEQYLDKKIGLESEAIDRKRPEDRRQVKWYEELNMALVWASGVMNLACFASGFLGWEFGLSLKESLLCYIFGTLIGSSATAYCATFGAATGLRQMSVSRYSFGWYPNKVLALLNAIQQIGWSAVGCITGGLALIAVADGHLSVAVGIIIIAAVALIIGMLGLRVILLYEQFAWIVFFVIFMIIFGESAKHVDNKTPTSLSGTEFSGAILTLLAVVYGSSASWATIASDYYVHYPANVSRVKVFVLTSLGLAIPTSIGMCAGAVAASTLNHNQAWNDAYNNGGIGFLLRDMLYPLGFAKFLLVLLVLSSISINIMNTYSAALSIQQISPILARIPRFLWAIVLFGIVIALGLAGRETLNSYLQNFLSLLGYWCTSYVLILWMEHVFVRKGNFANYDLESWNNRHGLPHGIAASITFLVGVVCWVMGMAETWYVGPLAARFGGSGGDLSNEFTLVFTCIAYLPLRYLEIKWFGK